MYSGARIYAKHQSRDPKDAAQVALCHRISQMLADLYPEHPWWIVGQPDNGTIGIGHSLLSTKMGYQIASEELDGNPTDFRLKVMRIGGEILERYEISRTARGEAMLEQLLPHARLAAYR